VPPVPHPEPPTSTLPASEIPVEHRWLATRYDISRELGRGGMAVVYLARDRETGDEVAVKAVAGIHLHDPEALGRFSREALFARV